MIFFFLLDLLAVIFVSLPSTDNMFSELLLRMYSLMVLCNAVYMLHRSCLYYSILNSWLWLLVLVFAACFSIWGLLLLSICISAGCNGTGVSLQLQNQILTLQLWVPQIVREPNVGVQLKVDHHQLLCMFL